MTSEETREETPGPVDEVEADGATSAEPLDDQPVPEDRLVEVTRERDEYLNALQRLQAEFENFRKRTLRQQSDLLERASESLLERLLPVLDALELARKHALSPNGGEASGTETPDPAIGQIAALLGDILAREGLERIDEAGVAFDPTIHDAVAQAEPNDERTGPGVAVCDVLRPGYRLKGRVLRPAMVKVEG